MKIVLSWINRVPLGVWLFIAVTQVVTIFACLSELPELNKTILAFQKSELFPGAAVELFENARKFKQQQLTCAFALTPIALLCAFLKWEAKRPESYEQVASDTPTC